MAQDSKIGWTDHTQNFWWGCHKVSEECHFCYISGIMRRGGYEPFRGPMRTKNWSNPRRWNRAARQSRKRLRVFTCSMSDFFHPGADAWRDEAWEVIRECESLDWLVLTKRPELIEDRLPSDWGDGYPQRLAGHDGWLQQVAGSGRTADSTSGSHPFRFCRATPRSHRPASVSELTRLGHHRLRTREEGRAATHEPRLGPPD